MAIPFLSYFKRKAKPEPVAPTPLAAPERKSGERLSKTVMPSATRTMGPDSIAATTNAYAQTISAPALNAPRSISFNGPAPSSRAADLPAAVALALEPNVERTVSLQLSEIVSQMPPGMVRPLQDDEGNRRVLLKASELERGMANGKPSVSVSSVYDQVPEIFARTITPSDPAQVALPFSAVLEQFSNLQTRGDQQRIAAVPQVQTPFLKVTMEDGERFGTSGDLPQIVDLPTVRVEPATAKTIAAAEPEPAPQPVAPARPFSFRAAQPETAATTNGAATESVAPAAAPTRIPFKLTPNGTGAPASESVPASNGPPVPSSFAPPPAAPTRIPFKVSAPSEEARPAGEPWLTKASFAADATAADAATPNESHKATAAAGDTITLSLKPILEMLPPMQLVGDVNDVPADASIDFPFSLLAPQLSSGRITVTPSQFAAALPAAYRSLFDGTAAAAAVSLPLPEVLKNLPSTSLQMREDQVEQEQGSNFETPFSAKAAEDAKRFQPAATTVPKPMVLPPLSAESTPPKLSVLPPPATVETKPAFEVVPKPAPAIAATNPTLSKRTALQSLCETDGELDAKAVVARIGEMDGVNACAIMFGDGLSLAGHLPAEYETDGLCAMAPSLMQRIENHMVETKLGALTGMTLSCSKAAVTFFMHDNLCLAALHLSTELSAEVRERLAKIVQELSLQYSHPV